MFALFYANDACLRLECDARVISAWIRRNFAARRPEKSKTEQIIPRRRRLVELETPLGVGSRIQKSIYVANVGRRAPHVHTQVGHRLSNCVNDAPSDARVGQKVEINRLATAFDNISLPFDYAPAAHPIADHTVWDL